MSAADTFAAAMRQHQAGRLAEAERLYGEVIAAQPRHLQALVMCGALAHMAGRNEKAVDLFGRALAIGEDPNLHYNIGLAKWALGQRADAAATLEAGDRTPTEFRASAHEPRKCAARGRTDRGGFASSASGAPPAAIPVRP